MKTRGPILLVFSALLMLGCRSAAIQTDSSTIDYLHNLVAERSYEINSDWAFPLMTQGLISVANAGLFMPGSNASRIDLIGNPNYLKVIGDSVSVSLPYFGERRMGGGYANSDVGIKFDGIPEDYKVQWDEQKNRYLIEMQFRQKTETFQLLITLFTSLKGDINVNSTHRTSIRFSGNVHPMAGK
jgi:hypothetical protein